MGLSSQVRLKGFLFACFLLISFLGLREALKVLRTPEPKRGKEKQYAYLFTNLEIRGWNRGRLTFTARGDKIRIDKERVHVVMSGHVKGKVMGKEKGEVYSFKSKEGEYIVPAKKLTVYPLTIQGEGLSLQTNKMFFSGKRRVMDFPDAIAVSLKHGKFRAARGVLYLKEDVLELVDAQGEFDVEKNKFF